MRRGGEEVLNEIAVLLRHSLARLHAHHSLAAAPLRAIGGNGGTLDEAIMGDRDDGALIRDEVLHRDFALLGNNLRAAGVAVLLLNLAQLVFDDLEDALLLGENVEQVLDRGDELVVLVLDRLTLEAGELVEAQVEDGVYLPLVEAVVPVDETAFVADQDANLLHGHTGPGKFEQAPL